MGIPGKSRAIWQPFGNRATPQLHLKLQLQQRQQHAAATVEKIMSDRTMEISFGFCPVRNAYKCPGYWVSKKLFAQNTEKIAQLRRWKKSVLLCHGETIVNQNIALAANWADQASKQQHQQQQQIVRKKAEKAKNKGKAAKQRKKKSGKYIKSKGIVNGWMPRKIYPLPGELFMFAWYSKLEGNKT